MLFQNQDVRVNDPEPSFLEQGFLLPVFGPSGKSRIPDFMTPINLAFRLRLILGMGVRSEMIRALLGPESKSMSIKELSNETAYSKRNVQEAVNDLRSADMLSEVSSVSSPRYSINSAKWFDFLNLGSGTLDQSLSWPQISFELRTLLRWTWKTSRSNLTDYMLASEAGLVASSVFATTGSPLTAPKLGLPSAPGYWDRFVRSTLNAVDELSLRTTVP